MTGVFQEALQGGVSNLSFGSLSTNLGRTMYEYKFRIPPYYTLLVRSLSVLEGIALQADPNYKVRQRCVYINMRCEWCLCLLHAAGVDAVAAEGIAPTTSKHSYSVSRRGTQARA